jgi:hypothetical protein
MWCFSGAAYNNHKYHNDGSKFREIRKMTNKEHSAHKKTLAKFPNNPHLHMPANLHFVDGKISHSIEIKDEQGRSCLLN